MQSCNRRSHGAAAGTTTLPSAGCGIASAHACASLLQSPQSQQQQQQQSRARDFEDTVLPAKPSADGHTCSRSGNAGHVCCGAERRKAHLGQAPCHAALSLRRALLAALLLPLTTAAARSLTAAGPSKEEILAREELGMKVLRKSYPDHDWSLNVTLLNGPPPEASRKHMYFPFERALNHSAMRQLYVDNLDVDIDMWRAKGQTLTMQMLLSTDKALTKRKPSSSRRLVMIKGGRVFMLTPKGPSLECAAPCNHMLLNMFTVLSNWVAAAPSEWPDVVFLLNTADSSVCMNRQNAASLCTAPVLSVIKEWGIHKAEDILVPLTAGMSECPALHYMDWDKKIDMAIFRGSHFCQNQWPAYEMMVCSRSYLSYVSQEQRAWAEYVDVGMVNDMGYTPPGATKEVKLKGRGRVPIAELARFKYLLAIEGITASSRLAKLLTINSPVFKQASPWVEWYYRSLVPGLHYISYWDQDKDDLLQELKMVESKTAYLQQVAGRGQAFAYQYLLPEARRLYWVRALQEYRGLFDAQDMDAFIAKQKPPKAAKGSMRKSAGDRLLAMATAHGSAACGTPPGPV